MSKSPFFIYPIAVGDLEKLRQISIQTFEETFVDTNTRENLDYYYERSYNMAQLLSELQNPESRFWFIDYKGALAGYLKVNTGEAQTELQERDGFEVEKIYVLQEFHRVGVGSALMNFAIDYGRKLGKKYLWLGVWEHNYRAQKFYARYGLKEFDDHVFMMGKQPQRDVLMRVELMTVTS